MLWKVHVDLTMHSKSLEIPKKVSCSNKVCFTKYYGNGTESYGCYSKNVQDSFCSDSDTGIDYCTESLCNVEQAQECFEGFEGDCEWIPLYKRLKKTMQQGFRRRKCPRCNINGTCTSYTLIQKSKNGKSIPKKNESKSVKCGVKFDTSFSYAVEIAHYPKEEFLFTLFLCDGDMCNSPDDYMDLRPNNFECYSKNGKVNCPSKLCYFNEFSNEFGCHHGGKKVQRSGLFNGVEYCAETLCNVQKPHHCWEGFEGNCSWLSENILKDLKLSTNVTVGVKDNNCSRYDVKDICVRMTFSGSSDQEKCAVMSCHHLSAEHAIELVRNNPKRKNKCIESKYKDYPVTVCQCTGDMYHSLLFSTDWGCYNESKVEFSKTKILCSKSFCNNLYEDVHQSDFKCYEMNERSKWEINKILCPKQICYVKHFNFDINEMVQELGCVPYDDNVENSHYDINTGIEYCSESLCNVLNEKECYEGYVGDCEWVRNELGIEVGNKTAMPKKCDRHHVKDICVSWKFKLFDQKMGNSERICYWLSCDHQWMNPKILGMARDGSRMDDDCSIHVVQGVKMEICQCVGNLCNIPTLMCYEYTRNSTDYKLIKCPLFTTHCQTVNKGSSTLKRECAPINHSTNKTEENAIITKCDISRGCADPQQTSDTKNRVICKDDKCNSLSITTKADRRPNNFKCYLTSGSEIIQNSCRSKFCGIKYKDDMTTVEKLYCEKSIKKSTHLSKANNKIVLAKMEVIWVNVFGQMKPTLSWVLTLLNVIDITYGHGCNRGKKKHCYVGTFGNCEEKPLWNLKWKICEDERSTLDCYATIKKNCTTYSCESPQTNNSVDVTRDQCTTDGELSVCKAFPYENIRKCYVSTSSELSKSMECPPFVYNCRIVRNSTTKEIIQRKCSDFFVTKSEEWISEDGVDYMDCNSDDCNGVLMCYTKGQTNSTEICGFGIKHCFVEFDESFMFIINWGCHGENAQSNIATLHVCDYNKCNNPTLFPDKRKKPFYCYGLKNEEIECASKLCTITNQGDEPNCETKTAVSATINGNEVCAEPLCNVKNQRTCYEGYTGDCLWMLKEKDLVAPNGKKCDRWHVKDICVYQIWRSNDGQRFCNYFSCHHTHGKHGYHLVYKNQEKKEKCMKDVIDGKRVK
uniref:G-protein coupled receptors family 2 profile 1 domain-containing protein n=1 Tax=Panagrolaimus sp. JU765 TaxID=591449 RepID=A0AC34RGH6_9BILA